MTPKQVMGTGGRSLPVSSEHEVLYIKVVDKTAGIIRSMDINSLWWIEQHLKDYKQRYNNDYKPKKATSSLFKTPRRRRKFPWSSRTRCEFSL
jgi:hypothetical protein